MANINEELFQVAKNDVASDLAKASQAEVFGYDLCDTSFGAVIAKNLIIEVTECTDLSELTQLEADCLMGKLQENLLTGCCD